MARFALSIGNNSYEDLDVLSNAKNDATDMHQLFKQAGYDSQLLINATDAEMKAALRELMDKVKGAICKGKEPVVVVFFSGHGVDFEKNTLLLPVDHSSEKQGLNVDGLIRDTFACGEHVTLVVLCDCCRDDPDNDTHKGARRKSAFPPLLPKSASRLGSACQKASGNRCFIGYACKAGTAALERSKCRNGFFTQALLRHLSAPGATLLQAFMRVTRDVETETRCRQGPVFECNLVCDPVLFTPMFV